MGIGSQLDAVADSAGAVFHEVSCPATIPATHKVANRQLLVGIHSHPGPNVAPSFRLLCRAGILPLAADETPNLIRLHPANLEVADVEIMEGCAGCPHIRK